MTGTTPTPPRPPGWYPDPSGGNAMSYWDGRRWTGRHRPRPSWQASQVGAGDDVGAGATSPSTGAPEIDDDGEARRRWAHGRRSWAVIGGALVVVVGLAWLTLPHPDHPGPRVVTDTAFVAAANARCKAVFPGLRPPLPDPNAKEPAIEETAAAIDRVADGLAGLASQLGSLPLAPADQAPVTGWLEGWTAYADIGHRYADSLRSGDHAAQQSLSKQGDAVQKTTDRFARANGLSPCQFFIAPQGSGSDPLSGGG